MSRWLSDRLPGRKYHILSPRARGATTRGPRVHVVSLLPLTRGVDWKMGLSLVDAVTAHELQASDRELQSGPYIDHGRPSRYEPHIHQGSDSGYYFLFRCTLSMIIRVDIHLRQKKRTTPMAPSRSTRAVQTAIPPEEAPDQTKPTATS